MKKLASLLVIILIATFSGVSAQTNSNNMDSLFVFASPGVNPQTEEIISITMVGTFSSDYVRSWVVRPNFTDTIFSTPRSVPPDSISDIYTGLTSNTVYSCGAYAIFSGLKSSVKVFTTALCSFTAGIEHSSLGCIDSVYSLQVGTPYTHQWKIGANNIPGATLPYYKATISGNYSCSVSNGTCTQISNTISVTITDLVIVASSPMTICKGDSVQISASGADAYSWSPIVGLNNPNIANPMAGPAATTNYTVTGSTNGCSGSASVKVTVVALPVVSIIPSATSACVDAVNDITFTLQPAGGTLFGDGISGNIFIPSLAGEGYHTINYAFTNASGCSGNASTIIRVLETPVVDSIKRKGSLGTTLIVYGSFAYHIDIKVGTKVYSTATQNSKQAIFDDVSISSGDLLLIRSTEGGCFSVWDFGLGVEEYLTKDLNQNADNRIFDLLGREVKNPQPGTLYIIRGGKKFIYKK